MAEWLTLLEKSNAESSKLRHVVIGASKGKHETRVTLGHTGEMLSVAFGFFTETFSNGQR